MSQLDIRPFCQKTRNVSFYPYYVPSYYNDYYPKHFGRYYQPVSSVGVVGAAIASAAGSSDELRESSLSEYKKTCPIPKPLRWPLILLFLILFCLGRK